MLAFLYLNLTVSEQPVSYQQAEVQLVKAYFPDVALLDMDADSDEMLLHYAKRMIQEADQLVVCLKAEEGASLQLLTTVLEAMQQAKGQHVILLRGENQRLHRILQARPQLNFRKVSPEAELLEGLNTFYS